MARRIRALLVYDDTEPLQSLNLALQNLNVEVCRARTCQEARRVGEVESRSPDIIFADATLPDSSWKELLSLERELPARPKVVLVGRTENPRLYLQAMEDGAFDFVLPPFESAGLAHVVRCATDYRGPRDAAHN